MSISQFLAHVILSVDYCVGFAIEPVISNPAERLWMSAYVDVLDSTDWLKFIKQVV